ncbi:hypothetical protein F4810DRAFT_599039 [Camillea tinctor]|nr:hypothetical protein F4810DRAFT_599039 [Camillea tinctor]
MSVPTNIPTHEGDSFSALLDSNEGPVDAGHYTSNFTRQRPPYLNGENTSSSQTNGPMTDSSNVANDGLATGRGNVYNPRGYAPSAQSTESTSATMPANGDAAARASMLRGHVRYWVERDYYTTTMQPLTEQAVDALNHDYRTTSHLGSGKRRGDIRGWIDTGIFAVAEANPPGSTGLDSSIIVVGHSSHSRVTLATTAAASSHSNGTSSSHLERMSENVCAAGWQFEHVPAYPAHLNIDDADTQ